MVPKSPAASVDRLESLAATALEELIEDMEQKEHVKVDEVDVALIHDAQGNSPTVQVTVTVKD
jgi:hypothetical protein